MQDEAKLETTEWQQKASARYARLVFLRTHHKALTVVIVPSESVWTPAGVAALLTNLLFLSRRV